MGVANSGPCPSRKLVHTKCDVKWGGEGGQNVNVIMTLRSAKVVWKCPLMDVVNFMV